MVVAKMYASDGSLMKCACGNPASTALIGAECYVSKCSDCMYPQEDKVGGLTAEWGSSSPVRFPTSGPQKNVEDAWTVKL